MRRKALRRIDVNRNKQIGVPVVGNLASFFQGNKGIVRPRENGEVVYSVEERPVQQILANMISTTKINDSGSLAGHVQERLHSSVKKKYSSVKDLGVKEGPFFVLHDTNMPSILVEVGFITNSREEKRLRKSAYLDRLAASIARGIHEFKRDRGPTI